MNTDFYVKFSSVKELYIPEEDPRVFQLYT